MSAFAHSSAALGPWPLRALAAVYALGVAARAFRAAFQRGVR